MKKNLSLMLSILALPFFGQKDIFDIARNGTVEEIKVLIEKDKSLINIPNKDGNSLLILAVYRGNKDVAKYLIDKGASIDYNNSNGTALMGACFKGDVEMSEFLIKNGAGLNKQDTQGNTPLVFALINGNIKLLEMLISYKPDLQLKNKDGKSIIELAKSMNNPEINKLLKL